MSTLSPRLKLKRPEGTDQFLRQDYVDNLNLLDAKPGIHICTSSTRPTGWGAAELGMAIYETDTDGMYHWKNPGWWQSQNASPAWVNSTVINATLSSGATGTYNDILSITPTRTCDIYMIAAFKAGVPGSEAQFYTCVLRSGGVDLNVGFNEGVRHTPGTGTNSRDDTVPVFGRMLAVAPGTYSIGGRIAVGSGNDGHVEVAGIKIMAFMVNASGGAG